MTPAYRAQGALTPPPPCMQAHHAHSEYLQECTTGFKNGVFHFMSETASFCRNVSLTSCPDLKRGVIDRGRPTHMHHFNITGQVSALFSISVGSPAVARGRGGIYVVYAASCRGASPLVLGYCPSAPCTPILILDMPCRP